MTQLADFKYTLENALSCNVKIRSLHIPRQDYDKLFWEITEKYKDRFLSEVKHPTPAMNIYGINVYPREKK